MPSSTKNNQTILNVIFEDDDLMVLNKPSGVVVNVSETSSSGTIQNALMEEFEYDEDRFEEFENEQIKKEFVQRSGIVHRLDKDTSGVLLVAKNPESFKNLKNQFQNREVKKEYIALVLGEFQDLKVRVTAPIGRNPNNRMKMAVVDGGRTADTTFELEKVVEVEGERFSLVICFPKTGRTHQIRVHLAAMKHPVVADPIYMTKKQLQKYETKFDRLMLHAWKASVKHPKTKKEQIFEAPLPKLLEEIYSKPY